MLGTPTTLDSRQAARSARLRYVSDSIPGIKRVSYGRAFRYTWPSGRTVRNARTLRRIRALAIPPAWSSVWICPFDDGHLQATGRDARRRKQYRYHPRWREIRDSAKYDRLAAFARSLPEIRRQVERDLRRRGLSQRRVLAAVVRLLESTLIRVGNEEYARGNGSFGLTTLRNRHADVRGGTIRFIFRGKCGKRHVVDIRDPRLARIVKRCQELPGQDLFEFVDDNEQVRDIGSGDVNDYLREISGSDFTAKDFRTWAGTTLALEALQSIGDFDSRRRAKRNVAQAIEQVAERLGNTKAVCRKCYVHPAVIGAYLDRSLRPAPKNPNSGGRSTSPLRATESAVRKLLHRIRGPV